MIAAFAHPSQLCMIRLFDTHPTGTPLMRTNIDIDDTLMAEAQKASGHRTKRATVEEALRLIIKLRRQKAVEGAFGRYRWRGDLAKSRQGRGLK